jgi:thiosulfate/3-mercaptopyruvate sulfurtransferase
VKLINGGRAKWIAEGRPLTKDKPSVKPATYKAKDPNKSLRAFYPEVEVSRASSAHALVDVRSPDEFTGKIIAPPGLPETAQRAGHIPGAKSIPWAQAVKEDSTFKSADDLRKLYEGKGVTSDKDVIAYCRIGERSSHTWFVLHELLGFPKVSNYDGSWTEWGNVVGAAIEKGGL